MEFSIAKLLGFAAPAFTTTAYAPQFIKAWRSRSTSDISLGMFLLMVTGICLWFIYGILIGDAPVTAANAVAMMLSGGILLMKLKYK